MIRFRKNNIICSARGVDYDDYPSLGPQLLEIIVTENITEVPVKGSSPPTNELRSGALQSQSYRLIYYYTIVSGRQRPRNAQFITINLQRNCNNHISVPNSIILSSIAGRIKSTSCNPNKSTSHGAAIRRPIEGPIQISRVIRRRHWEVLDTFPAPLPRRLVTHEPFIIIR